MLPPEPIVLVARQGFADAQDGLLGALGPPLGYFQAGWYGTNVDDERGSFAIVSATGGLATAVGDVLNVSPAGQSLSVNVYVIGTSLDLDVDVAMTRRPFMAIARLDQDPLEVVAATVSLAVVPT